MRLWSIHPKYLDAKGLVALWREALLAQHVLAGTTHGYKHHPQLLRFQRQRNPLASLDAYLFAVYNEAAERGYTFDRTKIGMPRARKQISVTTGQLAFELEHLKRKLWIRDRKKFVEIASMKKPKAHPLFRIVSGKIESWEKI
jgi:Pyrimidine dimer DNA glycosylase